MKARVTGSAIGLATGLLLSFTSSTAPGGEERRMIGINVLLDRPADDMILADLAAHAQILNVLPEIGAVTVRAGADELAVIQSLSYVAWAGPDAPLGLTNCGPLPLPDLSAGANEWCLDAINVTDVGGGRTVAYDGEGVYVAVIDTGLPYNWRCYFPEERVATQFARAFTGGGGQAHAISSQPQKWGHDTNGHGTTITSVILGFAFSGPDDELPTYFNGAAPKATIIPIRFGFEEGFASGHWESVAAQAIVYAANLKVSGALGGSPLVINLSSGEPSGAPVPMMRAAIDYAIAAGVVVVIAAGNEADLGMRYPGAYPEVISVAASGWIDQFPSDDPTTYRWMLRDVPENDATQHYIAPFSSRELQGQELDIAAPGMPVPVPCTVNGQADYTFFTGTSQAAPHVAGVAAMMLQKNPGLAQSDIEGLLRDTAMALPPACVEVVWPAIGPGDPPTFDDHDNVYFFDLFTCWGANATGAGLLQADAALAATPLP